jgi:hypothetical protein
VLNINEETMRTVAQEAFDRAQGNGRWQRAIAKAVEQIRENPYIHFDGDAALILFDTFRDTLLGRMAYTAGDVGQAVALPPYIVGAWQREQKKGGPGKGETKRAGRVVTTHARPSATVQRPLETSDQ